jgi:exodeoxyribonuclease VII large subunit
VQIESHRLLSLWKRLQASSPSSVLNRGFAIIKDDKGRPLARAADLTPDLRVKAVFADGERRLTVESD